MNWKEKLGLKEALKTVKKQELTKDRRKGLIEIMQEADLKVQKDENSEELITPDYNKMTNQEIIDMFEGFVNELQNAKD